MEYRDGIYGEFVKVMQQISPEKNKTVVTYLYNYDKLNGQQQDKH
jgi:hypothetical protein